MFNLINNILNPIKLFAKISNDTDPLTVKVLEEVKRNRTPLTLKFPNDNLEYASMILDIDTDQKIIRIDEIFPEDGNQKALKATELFISTRNKGILLSFDVTISKTGKENGLLYYDLDFPLEVDQLQRRAAFRVIVPISSPIKANFILDGYPNFKGVVSDISLSGLRMQLPNNVTSIFQNIKYIENVQLNLGENIVNCRFRVCYCEYNPSTRLTSLGCEFSNLTYEQQRQITKLVTKLERASNQKPK